MSAALDQGNAIVLPGARKPNATTSLQAGVLMSVGFHMFVVFGIGLTPPKPRNLDDLPPRLDVVLVNAKTATKPEKAEALAQVNLDGGGNTDAPKRLKTPLPPIETPPIAQAKIEKAPKKTTPKKAAPEKEARKKVEKLEDEAKMLISRIESAPPTVKAPQEKPQEAESQPHADTGALLQRSMAIARLEAEISREWEEYQKRPRRVFLGARVQEYLFARYVDDWRSKVERVGNLNYPQAAREQKVHGSLVLTVSIKSDGSVEKVEINRTSGHKILDAAAIRIVELASPFAVFSEDIRKRADILAITRTWTFTRADQLISE